MCFAVLSIFYSLLLFRKVRPEVEVGAVDRSLVFISKFASISNRYKLTNYCLNQKLWACSCPPPKSWALSSNSWCPTRHLLDWSACLSRFPHRWKISSLPELVVSCLWIYFPGQLVCAQILLNSECDFEPLLNFPLILYDNWTELVYLYPTISRQSKQITNPISPQFWAPMKKASFILRCQQEFSSILP